jgi:hypothetical protein
MRVFNNTIATGCGKYPGGPPMTRTPSRYRSFLVRLWRSESDDPPVWHASTEDTMTGERRNFAGMAQLFGFLEQQVHEPQADETTAQPAPDGRSA